jgi:hypothetical protein
MLLRGIAWAAKRHVDALMIERPARGAVAAEAPMAEAATDGVGGETGR